MLYLWVSFVGFRIPMDPDTMLSLRSRIWMDLLPYCEGRSMIPVDLSANCEVGSMIPADPGSRSLGSDPSIRFRDPRTCLITSNHHDYTLHSFFKSHADQDCIAKLVKRTLADPGGNPAMPSQSPGRGIMSFAPPPPKKKKLPKTFFRKWIWVNLENSGLNPLSFQFGGTLGWDPIPSCPPPRTAGGWIRQWKRMVSDIAII